MKTITLFVLCFLVSLFAFAQQKKTAKELMANKKQINLEIPENPLYPDGNKKCFSLSNFVSNGSQIDSLFCEKFDSLSGIWVNEYLGVMYYDKNGLLLTDVEFSWNTNMWQYQDSISYLYNSNGQLLEENRYTYNNLTSSWILSVKEIFTYDESSRLIVDAYYSDWIGGEWTYGWKDSSVYNAIGLRIEKYSYQLIASVWEQNYKYTYYYGSTQLLTETINQLWTGSTWENSSKITYAYDDHGNMIEYINFYWDGMNWIASFKSQSTYNATNNQITYHSYYWDGITWMLSTYDSIAYNANGFIEEEYYYYYWNDSIYYGYWYTYEYNADNNMTELRAFTWTGLGWKNYYMYQIAYFTGGGVQYVYSLWDGFNWVYNSRCTSTYNPFSSIAELSPVFRSILYPNPMKNFTTLTLEGYTGKISEILIYDIEGRKVYINANPILSNSIVIERGSLKAGTYYYQVLNNKTPISGGKIIIAD